MQDDLIKSLRQIVDEHLVANKQTHIRAESLIKAIGQKLDELQADIDGLKKSE